MQLWNIPELHESLTTYALREVISFLKLNVGTAEYKYVQQSTNKCNRDLSANMMRKTAMNLTSRFSH